MRFNLQDELQSLGFAFKRPSEHFKNMNSTTESEGQTPQLPNTQDASESSARVNTAESASERSYSDLKRGDVIKLPGQINFDYRVLIPAHSCPIMVFEQLSAGKVIGYEVVKMRWQKAVTRGDIEFKAGWRMPSVEEWGRNAFTYSAGQEEKARLKCARMCEVHMGGVE